MLQTLYELFSLVVVLSTGVLSLYIFYRSMKGTTTFQKLNRITVVAVLVTFFGLLFLGYRLLHVIIGTVLVLFLIRISYVIYVDSTDE